MDRTQRIEIAKRILEFNTQGQYEMGEESWETDTGRFTDKARFELEKEEFFLKRPQLIAYTADFPENGDYYATDIAGKSIILLRNKKGQAAIAASSWQRAAARPRALPAPITAGPITMTAS
jgi:hypothetical protein